MKNCKGCKYAKWAKTKAGRLHPSGDGECTFVVKIPVLPASRYYISGGGAPSGGYIDRNMELKVDCPCYQPE